MTQAFNLSQLANNVNTSGQLDATDGLVGLVDNANLASSGTASSSTYLRGDRTWATISAGTVSSVTVSPGTGLTGGGTITTSGTVTLSLDTNAGAIGTYAFLGETTNTDTAVGGTQSGSSLRYSGISATSSYNLGYKDGAATGSTGTTNTPAGTWQCMGQSGPVTNNYYGLTLWIRVA